MAVPRLDDCEKTHPAEWPIECPHCALAEIARLQHIIDCAETPLMADVIRERDEALAALREVLAVSKCPYDSECRADVLSSSEDWCPVCKARAVLEEKCGDSGE